jgi:predicted nucleic-acid-binding Zn-ribbon protein
MNKGVHCPKCGSQNTFINANVMITAPSVYFHGITKSAFRKKEIRLDGVGWDRVVVWCMDCGWYSSDKKEDNNAS